MRLTTHSSGRRPIARVLPSVAVPAPLNSSVSGKGKSMHVRTLAFAACVVLTWQTYDAAAQNATMSDQCKALIKQYWNTMHVVMDSGTTKTKADSKPGTLQVVLASDLAKGQSNVSSDGQVIYISTQSASNQELLQHLTFVALERRIASGSDVSCPGIEALLNGR